MRNHMRFRAKNHLCLPSVSPGWEVHAQRDRLRWRDRLQAWRVAEPNIPQPNQYCFLGHRRRQVQHHLRHPFHPPLETVVRDSSLKSLMTASSDGATADLLSLAARSRSHYSARTELVGQGNHARHSEEGLQRRRVRLSISRSNIFTRVLSRADSNSSR